MNLRFKHVTFTAKVEEEPVLEVETFFADDMSAEDAVFCALNNGDIKKIETYCNKHLAKGHGEIEFVVKVEGIAASKTADIKADYVMQLAVYGIYIQLLEEAYANFREILDRVINKSRGIRAQE